MRTAIRIALSLPFCVLILALSSCGQKRTPPPPILPEVTVARPFQREITDYQDFTGRIEAMETAEVRARVKGYLQRIQFKEGTEVKKDELLYEIDPREYQAEVEKAEAAVKQQETQVQ